MNKFINNILFLIIETKFDVSSTNFILYGLLNYKATFYFLHNTLEPTTTIFSQAYQSYGRLTKEG